LVENIVIVTEAFPYGHAEPFLEVELKYLLNHYRRVVIVPREKSGKKRKIDPRIEIIDIPQIKYENIYSIFVSFASFFFWKETFSTKMIYKNIRRIKSQILIYGRATNIYKSLLRKDLMKSDTLFYSYWLSTGALALAMLKQKNLGIPVIARAHRHDIYEEENKYNFLPFRSFIFNNLDQIFPIAEHGKKYFIDRYALPSTQMRVARLGVVAQGVIAKQSEDKNLLHLLSCSNLLPVKRIGLLIQAFYQFGKEQNKYRIKWDHIGDGPESNKLKKLILELPGNISATFLGYQTPDEINLYYQSNTIDLLVNVSNSEGIPVTMMEAQSFSVPVMATNVGGVSEIVSNDNGYLLSANPTPKEISHKLHQIFDDKNDLKEKKIASKRMWKTHYDAESNYELFIKYLNEYSN